MNNSEKLVDVLNNLIIINNDRVEGYDKAAEETDDYALKALFESMARDSRKFASELAMEVAQRAGKVTTGTSTAGDLYRVWMDIKAAVTGKDRKTILSSCETGEDIAQKAYDEALRTDTELSTEIRQLLLDQKDNLKIAHDEIKNLRDAIVA